MSDVMKRIIYPYVDQKIDEAVSQKFREARQRGLAKGRKKAIIRNVVNSFSLEVSIDLIAQINKISVDEVKDILKEQEILPV